MQMNKRAKPCGAIGTRRRARGIAAVELGLVMMLLIPLVIGGVEVGRAVYAYDTLVKSVRSAARYLSTGVPSDAARQVEAKCIVVTGSPALSAGACAGTALLPDLTVDLVTIIEPGSSPGVDSIETDSGGTLSLVTVSIADYPLTTLGTTLFPALTFGAISATVPFIFF